MAAKPEKEKRSRQEKFEAEEIGGEDRPELDLPPVEYGGYLVDYLFEVGPSCAGEVLTFQELAAWSAGTGINLDAWETQTLRSLSNAYLSEIHDASDPKRPPPYAGLATKSASEVSETIKAMFEQMAAQHGTPVRPEAEPARQVRGGSSPGSSGLASQPPRRSRARSRPAE